MTARTHDRNYNQRRTVAFAAIIAVHLFIGWAFVTGFGQSVVHRVDTILQTTIIKQDQPKELPPPPPKPELDRPPPPSVPIPIINVNVPVETPPIVVTKAPPPPPPRPVAVVASTPVKTVSLPNCGEDYYPSQAKRLNQEGSAVVRVCFTAAGKIDAGKAIEVLSSSGYPLLDQAVGQCLSAGRYKAGTVDGKPVPSCKDFKVTYRLRSN